MKKNKTFINYSDYLFYLILFLLLISVFFVAFLFPRRNLGFRQEKAVLLKNTWEISWDETSISDTLPARITKSGLSPVYMSAALPPMEVDGDHILFWSRQSRSIVTLDGQVIWDSGEAVTRPFVFSLGSFWNCVRLPYGWEGKTLCIQMIPGIDDPAVVEELPSVYFGTRSAFLYKLLGESAFTVTICVFLFIWGVYYMASGLYTAHVKKAKQIFFLGAFAFCMGLWMLLECRVMQVFINNHVLIAYLSHISFELVPILGVRFFLSYEGIGKKRYMQALYLYGILQFAFIRITSCAGLWYEHQLQFLVRFYIIAAVLGLAFTEWSLYREKKLFEEKSQIYGLGILLVSTVAELVHFYVFSKAKSGTVLQAGILVFVCVTGIRIAIEGRHLRSEALERETLARIAYEDGLTHLGNRFAFEEEMSRLREGSERQVAILLADIDDLKYINDNFGHLAGDQAICTLAGLLSDTAHGSLKAYRIGGDEFCVISHQLSQDQVQRLVENLKRKIGRQRLEYPFRVSIGSSFGPTSRIDQLFRMADEAMYRCKRRSKHPGRESLLEGAIPGEPLE
ncbi:MAG: GGDEF domain-containing protein [Eubacteriales bacterium]|nr:GGDEF domain-containing protein [Eubacteriales bacterium]